MIIGTRAATSSQLLPLPRRVFRQLCRPTPRVPSKVLNRALFYRILGAVQSGRFSQPPTKNVRTCWGFSAFDLDRRDDEVVDKRLVAAYKVRLWPIASVTAVRRYVRSRTNSGSFWRTIEKIARCVGSHHNQCLLIGAKLTSTYRCATIGILPPEHCNAATARRGPGLRLQSDGL